MKHHDNDYLLKHLRNKWLLLAMFVGLLPYALAIHDSVLVPVDASLFTAAIWMATALLAVCLGIRGFRE